MPALHLSTAAPVVFLSAMHVTVKKQKSNVLDKNVQRGHRRVHICQQGEYKVFLKSLL